MLIIIRGCPGTGKSTTANKLRVDYEANGFTVSICSNDNYPGYYDNAEDVYDWTPQKAKLASQWCWDCFHQSLRENVDIIILDNTNLNKKSYGKYQLAAEAASHEVVFVEFEPPLDNAIALEEYIDMCASRNTHGVTHDILRGMVKAWEASPFHKTKETKP